jgi:uncharacterized membrane protein YdjX (TVP38/TMEM64 family)
LLCNAFQRNDQTASSRYPVMRRVRQFRPLLLLLPFAGAAAVAIGFSNQFGWDSLARNQEALSRAVTLHPVASAMLFLLSYVLVAALSLPHASVLTIAGGLLFGTVAGCILTVTGATIGASLLLLAARSVLGEPLARRGGRIVETVRERLRRDGFLYLLALRLIPLFPFWAVNLAASVGGMRLRAFVPATVLGIIPTSLILSSVGSGVGDILAAGRAPDLSVVLAPRILLPLSCLALLSLLPAMLRRHPASRAP